MQNRELMSLQDLLNRSNSVGELTLEVCWWQQERKRLQLSHVDRGNSGGLLGLAKEI
jgi:hypothetical protein